MSIKCDPPWPAVSQHNPFEHCSLLKGIVSTIMSCQWLCGVLVLLTVSYGVYGQGLSEEEKEELLNAHNHYRGQVDPVATNMLMMVSCEEVRY